MWIDDTIQMEPNLRIDNFYFRDAIHFKLPDHLFTEKDIGEISNSIRNNRFEYDLSIPPYNNVIYYFYDYSDLIVYWLIKFDEKIIDNKKHIHYIFTPFFIQNNILKSWIDKERDVLRIDFLQDSSDYSVKSNNIIIKHFSGEIFNRQSTNRRELVFVPTLLKINSLLNCVNIIKVMNVHPNKLQKSRKRKGKLPLQSYYTLKLKGHSIKYEDTMIKQDPQWNNRIHLCRGHFKSYTEEHPLFGKYTGLWWWQPCARGNNKEGVIYKNYELK